MAAAYPIGLVVSHVILAIAFYLVFTPVGLLMRWLGRDPMEREFDPSRASYWKKREERNEDARYFKQY